MQPDPLPRVSPSLSVELECPVLTCDASAAHLIVRSETVVTFRCATCRFVWSAQIDGMPPLVRQRVKALPSVY